MINVQKGVFIVLYGINNLGKTTQGHLLAKRLVGIGRQAKYLKYAIRDMSPSGTFVDDYLRHGNPDDFSSREFQILQSLNRTQFEPILVDKLKWGQSIVAEDYTGTGMAWGIGAGVDKTFLTKLNSHLLQPDLAILLDGERFLSAVETGHRHETDDELTNRVREVHMSLAMEYDWTIINANQGIEKVASDIWQAVEKIL